MKPEGSAVEDKQEQSIAKSKPVSKAAPKKQGIKVVKKKSNSRSSEIVESDIAQTEKLLSDISERMGTPDVARDADRLKSLNTEYQQTESRLRELYEEWDRVSQEPANA